MLLFTVWRCSSRFCAESRQAHANSMTTRMVNKQHCVVNAMANDAVSFALRSYYQQREQSMLQERQAEQKMLVVNVGSWLAE